MVTRAQAATQGITLTRASQTVFFSERGEERFDNVTMFDLRLSKAFRFGTASITPQIDFFNLGNADTATGNNAVVGTQLPVPGRDPVAAHHPRRRHGGVLAGTRDQGTGTRDYPERRRPGRLRRAFRLYDGCRACPGPCSPVPVPYTSLVEKNRLPPRRRAVGVGDHDAGVAAAGQSAKRAAGPSTVSTVAPPETRRIR